MAQRIPAGLRVDAQPVRPVADADPGEKVSVAGIDRIHLRVVTAGKPKHLAIGRNATHIGAAAPWEDPLARNLARREVEDGDASLAAVRNVEPLGVPAHVQPVRTLA